MLQKLETLKNKITSLENKNDSSCLIEAYNVKDYNLLFRRAAAQFETLDILRFLYSHRVDLNINVNMKGTKSNKSAIDVAIENKSEMTVLFLLQTKEVKVDDPIRDKIMNQFGVGFRKKHIATQYVELSNKLIQYKPELIKLTDEYQRSKKIEKALKTANKAFELVITINAKKWEEKSRAQVSQTSELTDSRKIDEDYSRSLETTQISMDVCINEITRISQAYDNFEKTFLRYLPYSYAQEKLLYGNEHTINNPNSTMLNTCIVNRKNLTKTMQIIQHNESQLIKHIEQLFIFFNIALSEITSGQAEKCLKTDQQSEVLTNDSQVFNDVQEKPLFIASKLNNSDLSKIPKNDETKPINKNFLHDKKKFLNTPPSARPEIASTSKASSPMLTRLQELSDELSSLKQKGQVKLSSFLPLLKAVGDQIELEIKKTKKGILVKHSEQSFSFHLPHGDKGVDKNAVNFLGGIVDEQINTFTC